MTKGNYKEKQRGDSIPSGPCEDSHQLLLQGWACGPAQGVGWADGLQLPAPAGPASAAQLPARRTPSPEPASRDLRCRSRPEPHAGQPSRQHWQRVPPGLARPSGLLSATPPVIPASPHSYRCGSLMSTLHCKPLLTRLPCGDESFGERSICAGN